MPADTSLVRLSLRVRDLDAVLDYYTGALGFEVERDGGVSLVLAGRRFVIDLVHEPHAPLRPYPCVGLYHFALVVPDRAALGAIFRRVVDEKVELEGMADHGVSEALYLRDPEGNGIELYHDRPRSEWPYEDGRIAMVSTPLDVDGVIGSAAGPAGLAADTRFGHIHLHVPSLQGAEAFYAGELGLAVTQRSLPGALFFAAGGYHHHVGANTWAPDVPVPEGATGLVDYTWRLPAGDEPPAGPLHDPSGAEVVFETG